MNETRVGYMSIDVLCTLLKDYIVEHTENHKYIGELRYLNLYQQYTEYLKR